jgi:phenylalanyl-tRNA synthetase beta chain
MKVSLEWLQEYVGISLPPPELGELLTQAGLEVETLTECNPGFHRVVVAEMRSFSPHPKSGHLSICLVQDGQKDYTVVCGAPNLKVGDKVALALEGASLPGRSNIERTVLLDVASEGMLCSEKELGLSDEASGIMVLDPELTLGVPIEQALPLKDWILDVNVTPNRSDCLCILGMAREIAALTGQPLRPPIFKGLGGKGEIEKETAVVIESPDLCPRYVAKLITGVRIGASPFWMRRRLQALGVRSINNIVDVTNYVMLEVGQPLHAFDFNQLEEKRIVVRTAESGESFTTLDNIQRSLPENALMICDGKKPVALAGIMGGLNSEVQPGSRNILLESAYFDPMGIRRTSKKMGLSTEASVRFERGIDPNGSLKAAERAAALMVAMAGGMMAAGAIDNYPRRMEPKKILLRAPRVNSILGTAIPHAEVPTYLQRLGLEVKEAGKESFEVTVPTFRVDLDREIDLIEEIARLHGFNRIPVTIPSGTVMAEKENSLQRAAPRARSLLVGMGLREVITFGFISAKMLKDLGIQSPDPRANSLRIQNPLSEDQAIMRTTLIPGLLQVVQTNINRQNLDLKIFELGRVFFPLPDRDLPEEIETLGGILTGQREEESWAKPNEKVDFYDLKGIIEVLLQGFGVPRCEFLPEKEDPFLHPGKACRLVAGGEILGVMGEAHARINELLEIKQVLYLFEINFKKLVDQVTDHPVFKPLARFPAVTRDLALIVDEGVPARDLVQTLEGVNPGLIQEITIFDLYRGKPIPAGKKSVAFRLIFQREDRTLTDLEVNELHREMVDLVAKRHGAILR